MRGTRHPVHFLRRLRLRRRFRSSRSLAGFTSLAVLGGIIAAGPIALADPVAVPVQSVTTAHPRLIASDADFATTFGLINSDNTARAWSAAVIKEADGYLSTSPVTYNLSDGTLLETSRTVMKRAYALGFAFRKTGKSIYSNRLRAELEATAAFPDWNPDNFLDTAEMAHGVAVGYDWIYTTLSATQRQNIRTALVDKALKPAVSVYSSPAVKYAWTKQASNWNLVSGSGIGMAALVVADTDPAPAQAALDAVDQSLGFGLASYGADGGFAEGLTYWAYSTSYLTSYIASLRVSVGDDRGLLATPGLQASAQWANALTGPSGRQFNFGDAWTNESLSVPLLGLEYLYKDFGFRARSVVGREGQDADVVSARPLLWYRPAPAVAPAPPLDSVHPSAGVTTLRSGWNQRDALWAGLRATTGPITGHSDLDNGTFVLDAQGVNWFGELGADSYALPGYFTVAGDERWTYYRKRAEGSNTVVFPRGSGPDATTNPSASQSLVSSTADRAATVADLSSASDGVSSWNRGVSLVDGRSRALVQDEITGATGDGWWFAHTRADIDIADDGRSAILSLEGEQLLARIVSSEPATFSYMAGAPLPSSPSPAGQTVNSGMAKLAVKLSGSDSYTLAVEFTPLRQSSSPAPLAVSPLASWNETTAESGAPTLKSLAVNGKALSSFSPMTRTYDTNGSVRSAPPTITATAPPGSTVAVTQAIAVPGVATVRVKRTGSADAVYRVYINRGPIQVSTATASVNSALAARTVDGLPYTRWSATTDAHLQYDLGYAQIVSHLEIVWMYLPTQGQFFEIQASLDKSSWTTVYTGQAKVVDQRQWASFQTGPRNGRYFRVVTHGDKVSDKNAVIDEVEFYGDNNPRAATSPRTPHFSVTAVVSRNTVEVGESSTVTGQATAPPGASTSVPPITYVTSDPSIATVSPTGEVMGVSAGSARVGALVEIDRDYVYQLQTITVTDAAKQSLTAFADTWVQGGTTVNYNRASTLTVRHHALYPQFDRLAYMKFNLAGVEASRIESATLTFRAGVTDSGGTNIDVEAWETQGMWDPASVTFATRPTMTYRVGSTAVDSVKSVRRIDITDYARLKAGGEASIGLTQPDRPGGLGLVVQVDSIESAVEKPTIELDLLPEPIRLPNTPIITEASADYEGAGSVRGTVTGNPGETLKVDVYVQPQGICGPTRASGLLLGSTTVVAGDDGRAFFAVTGGLEVGEQVVAASSLGGRSSAVSACRPVTPTPGATTTMTITPSADTWVNGSAPTQTYGRDSSLQLRHLSQYPTIGRVAYMMFDLSKVPAGTIESATLRFSAAVEDTRGTAMDITVKETSAAWSPSTMSWSNRPALGDLLGTIGVDTTRSVRSLDVTSYVSSSPRTMAAFGIDEPDIATGIGLVVKIDSMESIMKPTLDVVYRPV